MKIKFFFLSLFICLSIASVSANLSGCEAHIGQGGAGAHIG